MLAPILASILGLTAICAFAQPPALTTRWTKDVSKELPHPEYPRPMMVRGQWQNLNGQWALATRGQAGVSSNRDILVPFPVESDLSGAASAPQRVWEATYSRSFEARPGKGRTLLHFGAVDWHCTVSLNGKEVGEHKGGFDPFTLDITDAIAPSGQNILHVRVDDPSDEGGQPRGKQTLTPQGIMYTPVSGIWQTVWLENIPETSIDDIRTTATPAGGLVQIDLVLRGPSDGITQEATIMDGSTTVATVEAKSGQPLLATVKNPKLWSPEHPHLYNLKVRLLKDGKKVDEIKSYFAFRTIEVKKDSAGVNRIFLNDKQIFVFGPLDQGFWPDGIYTPPTDAAMKYDLEVTKRLGFNMIRKHVKVEPETWYAACDKLGLLVWQDMPSGDNKTDEDKVQFKKEFQAIIDSKRNHPCIVAWVLFNEGWGQHDTENLTKWLTDYEPNRIIDSVTGWTDKGVGVLSDIHVYPGPGAPKLEANRATFLGEFGGLGLPVPGHMWKETGWGYQSFKNSQELTDRFVELMTQLRFLKAQGLTGAVYTQTTDVETELNGLMTYDRAMIKLDEKRITEAIKSLYLPDPKVGVVIPTSEGTAQTWQYTFDSPATGWEKTGFDDHAWSSGKGGFGTPETPGAVIGTAWSGKDIWLRRHFELAKGEGGLYLRMHHDDEAEVYIDGQLVSKQGGWTTGYSLFPIKIKLEAGTHIMAIHCHQNEGGQFIDAGLMRVVK